MLFDPRPKDRRVDLYDFEGELRELMGFLGEPFVVVSGLRRTGKTSLILTALNECGRVYVYVDLREGVLSAMDLYKLLSRSFTDVLRRLGHGSVRDLLFRVLSRVRGVSVMGFEVSIGWSPRERPLLGELFDALDEWGERLGERVVVVLDEFQRVRSGFGVMLQSAVAHSYDFNRNVSFVVSGSEMGVLYGVLRSPESPLYGRAYVEVRTRKLSREESLEFLSRGFDEAGFRVGREELERVVDELDGIIGWLTYYGYLRLRGRGSLDDIIKESVELAKRELEVFLSTRMSRRYKLVMRLLAEGVRGWSDLKRGVERVEGRELSDRALYEILQQLKRHSLINENNEYTDPINRRAAMEL